MGMKTGVKGSAHANSDYFISLQSCQGFEFPKYVLVRYAPQPTTGREQAPPPSNGFVCDNSPFDRGHVCALELGGPDIPENIVPQWRAWQETGVWRQLESVDIPKHASAGDLLLFRVVWLGELVFAKKPPQADVSCYEAYAAETLIAWDDFRIPRSFKFWLIAKSNPAHAGMSGGLGTQDLSARIDAFVDNAGAPLFERDQAEMPAEDHCQLERQQVVSATTEFMDMMETVHEEQVSSHAGQLLTGGGKLTRRQAEVLARKLLGDFQRGQVIKTFTPTHAKLFRMLLVSRCNFTESEAAHFTVSRILAAHGGSYPRSAVKALRPRTQATQFKARRQSEAARAKAHAALLKEARGSLVS